jgi:polysaccharide chain length determinant protein (PEP-CTERM system associated)
MVPFCCIALASCVVLVLLPVRYTSSATLLVVQQQVPLRYVVPNSTTDVTSALQAMKQEVLSRAQLLRMVTDFGLYQKQRQRLAPEQLIDLMSSNIDIVPFNQNPQQLGKDFDAFKIAFTTENPLLAQQVTNNLTSLFINEYLRTGAEQATYTTNFFQQQVEEKRKELEAQEERLRNFKLQHVGELPEQQPGNLGILTGLQAQLQSTMASLNRAQQQRALLQAELQATPRRRPASDIGPAVVQPGNSTQLVSPIDAAQMDVSRLEAERSTLLSKGYTSQHPDMARNQRDLARAGDKLKRLKAAAPPAETALSSAQSPSTALIPEPADDPATAQLKSSLQANRLEIENLTREEARLKAAVAQYENRINQTPVREQQEAGILRDTEVLRQQYAELQKKAQESQLATNLEKQQGGQQFRLIDPASLPSLPSSPKRGKISLGGAAGGLALGLALAILMEMRDTSFRTEKDLTKQLSPLFVLGIPVLPTPQEERRRKWRNIFQWTAASAMVLLVVAAELYVNKSGLRGLHG